MTEVTTIAAFFGNYYLASALPNELPRYLYSETRMRRASSIVVLQIVLK